MTTPIEDVDAIVIGSNIRGLVTTYVLNRLGCKTVLIDRSPAVGGVDGSFVTPGDTRFEYGMHVLDYERSLIATRLFTRVVDGAVHKIKLRRGIVLRDTILPYAPSIEELPDSLRAMFPAGGVHDDIRQEIPTRARLESCYGKPFIDFVFDEVLPSFPTENRHREFGVEPDRLLANIYPWFFPRTGRKPQNPSESRRFHDRLRAGEDQYLLYPREGGFGGFANGFLASLDDGVEVLLGAGDVHLEIEPGTHTVSWVQAKDRRFRAPHVFWGASWPALCKLLDVPCQDIATDRVIIGSFRLNRPARSDYLELLFGDPSYHINRLYLPARFRESDEPLLQLEFAYPKADDRPTDPEAWRTRWLDDLRRIGVLDTDHEVEEFDFKSVVMHFNAYGMEGEPLREADPTLLRADSNVRPVVPSMANLNLNNHVPRTVAYVSEQVARHDL